MFTFFDESESNLVDAYVLVRCGLVRGVRDYLICARLFFRFGSGNETFNPTSEPYFSTITTVVFKPESKEDIQDALKQCRIVRSPRPH